MPPPMPRQRTATCLPPRLPAKPRFGHPHPSRSSSLGKNTGKKLPGLRRKPQPLLSVPRSALQRQDIIIVADTWPGLWRSQIMCLAGMEEVITAVTTFPTMLREIGKNKSEMLVQAAIKQRELSRAECGYQSGGEQANTLGRRGGGGDRVSARGRQADHGMKILRVGSRGPGTPPGTIEAR